MNMLLHNWNSVIRGANTEVRNGTMYIAGTSVGKVTLHPTDGYSVTLPDFRRFDGVDLGDLALAVMEYNESEAAMCM